MVIDPALQWNFAAPKLIAMRSKLAPFVLLRITLAIVFGAMSLGHGTVMTFAHAHAALGHDQITAGEHTGHHGHDHGNRGTNTDTEDQHPASPLGAPALCFPAGCFITIASLAAAAPVRSLTPLGKLVPSGGTHMVAAPLEPADPPPRFPV